MHQMHAGLITLVFMLAGIGALLGAMVTWLMAWSLTHPPRMTDGKAAWVLRRLSPADLGLPFEDVRFQVRDENGNPLGIAAWWIPNSQSDGRCAVLLHGYADAKVGAIAWAPVWHAMGFNLLVPDLRAHGESEGTVCTAGYFERQDLVQVLDEWRARRPDQTRQIVLFGASLGAAVAAATAALMSDAAAVVMESPYADFRRAATTHMDRLGAPGRSLQRLAIRLAEWLTRSDYHAVRPTHLIAHLPCPVLAIQSDADPFLAPGDLAAIERALGARPAKHGPAELWLVPGVEHLMALSADPEAYCRRIARFLADASVHSPNPDAMTV